MEGHPGPDPLPPSGNDVISGPSLMSGIHHVLVQFPDDFDIFRTLFGHTRTFLMMFSGHLFFIGISPVPIHLPHILRRILIRREYNYSGGNPTNTGRV